MATKPACVIRYCKELPSIKSHVPFTTESISNFDLSYNTCRSKTQTPKP